MVYLASNYALFVCVVGRVEYDESAETATLLFEEEISPGDAVVSLEYTGLLNDKMRGFYRSKYTLPDEPDKELYAAVTQFEVCHTHCIVVVERCLCYGSSVR